MKPRETCGRTAGGSWIPAFAGVTGNARAEIHAGPHHRGMGTSSGGLRNLVLALAIAATGGCGYQLRGGVSLPPALDAIHVAGPAGIGDALNADARKRGSRRPAGGRIGQDRATSRPREFQPARPFGRSPHREGERDRAFLPCGVPGARRARREVGAATDREAVPGLRVRPERGGREEPTRRASSTPKCAGTRPGRSCAVSRPRSRQ